MKNNENYLNYILDQLSELENFTFKKMMGGIGFFREGFMFGTIKNGKFQLKSSACAEAPCPNMTKSHSGDLYMDLFFEVPEKVITNKSMFRKWVEKTIASAKPNRKRVVAF